ncbi:PadR family transcriptional regulator [Paracoccus halophilus]|uniref:PadR family transcriptional regulator n=1 Tax=Paracoccus halophilus TaxID=376733 RepID=UPI000944E478
MLKGHLDAIVLSVIASGASYGYAMIKEIRDTTNGVLDLPEGTIYPTLHRLENRGLITSRNEVAPSGRKRRVYSLTETGRHGLKERCDQWMIFSQSINSLLRKTKTTAANS